MQKLLMFYIAEHEGYTSVIFDASGDISRSDFLPFGTRWTNGQAAASRYQFTGYEDQELVDNKYMDAGARLYNGRTFNTLDPLAEKYYPISPYAYTLNNPVRYVDPNGMDVWEMNYKGEVRWVEESKEHIITCRWK